MNRLVYLAGGITGLSEAEVMGWRRTAQAELAAAGITTLCPIDAASAGDDVTEAVILRDKLDVQRCDIVLMNLLDAPRVSIGTMIELGWANAYGKPVVLVMDNPCWVEVLPGSSVSIRDGNVHEHGFVRSLTQFHCATLTDALATIKTILQ